MDFTIEHRTFYYYPDSVHESYTVAHLQPRSDALQFCSKYELRIVPDARISSYVDRFGNDVQHFAVLATHGSLSITTHSHVVTLASSDQLEPIEATRALLEADPAYETMWDYLHESAYVQFTPELSAFWRELDTPGERIGEWCHRVSRHIKSRLAYDTSATNVRSTVREALATRAGVCQDFAHIMIAMLRSAGIPARYVSGYIFRGNSPSKVLGADASHGWCEAYLPPYGWVGFDPTNDQIVNDHFVRIAIGRDYRDVSPVRGVYRGSGHSEMSVNVGMDLLQTARRQQEAQQQQQQQQ